MKRKRETVDSTALDQLIEYANTARIEIDAFEFEHSDEFRASEFEFNLLVERLDRKETSS